jgi:hypothetical protein
LLRSEQGETAPPIARLDGTVALGFEGLGEGLAKRRLILDDEDCLRHASESRENC